MLTKVGSSEYSMAFSRMALLSSQVHSYAKLCLQPLPQPVHSIFILSQTIWKITLFTNSREEHVEFD